MPRRPASPDGSQALMFATALAIMVSLLRGQGTGSATAIPYSEFKRVLRDGGVAAGPGQALVDRAQRPAACAVSVAGIVQEALTCVVPLRS